MLMPHPATLRSLLDAYESLVTAETSPEDTASEARRQDLAYTLCVSTGTREIAQALQVAHAYLDPAPGSTTQAVVIPPPPAVARQSPRPSHRSESELRPV
ncbi:DUF5133 domain-containing protein [Streptomyces sp. NPDC101237]|uniref:DUF5133 domain-containing protein n=1 Tax=Streptomyces sp. NPDC101237 TaxID=3366139 RepID=UPI0038295A7A